MSLYEQRLADDKSEIRSRIVALGHRVERAVGHAVEACLGGDHQRAYRLVLEDLPINRESRSIDRACHAFVARHLPSAGHLRFVSAVMRMNVELERIGDYAASIARHAVQLGAPPKGKVADDMRQLATEACEMLHAALEAFSQSDAELARKTKPKAKAVERSHEHIYSDLTSDATRPMRDTAGLLGIFNKLDRVSDQAKNICENTLFELLGEIKPPKRYEVLFVDATDTLVAPLAMMLARKSFPDSCSYHSAGIRPGESRAQELDSIIQDLGLDAGDHKPRLLDADADALAKYHVVIWLNGDPRKHIAELPYHTVLLQWELPKLADVEGGVSQRLREIAQALSAEIRDLVTLLRGEDAG